MRDDIRSIGQALGLPLKLTKSPPDLTEDGKQLVQKSGIADYVSNNLKSIQPTFENLKYQFDIFEKSKEEVRQILELKEDAIFQIKESFYREGFNEKILEQLFSIHLRNEILKLKEKAKK